ncbi:hypothetical protein D3C73_925950 [compost metagenome]
MEVHRLIGKRAVNRLKNGIIDFSADRVAPAPCGDTVYDQINLTQLPADQLDGPVFGLLCKSIAAHAVGAVPRLLCLLFEGG